MVTTLWTSVSRLTVEVARVEEQPVLLEVVRDGPPLWGKGLNALEPDQSAVVLALSVEQAAALVQSLTDALSQAAIESPPRRS